MASSSGKAKPAEKMTQPGSGSMPMSEQQMPSDAQMQQMAKQVQAQMRGGKAKT